MGKSKTCLYFGTFNPIHTGHLFIAQAVLSQFASSLAIETVTFIPAGNPPHRGEEPDLIPAEHRFRMVELAIAENSRFRVSNIELRLAEAEGRKSYTWETIEHLLEEGLAQKPVPMIIGSDALAGLGSWHAPETLAEAVLFLQAPRSGSAFVESVAVNGKTLSLNTRALDMPLLGISSTWIRRRIQETGDYEVLRYAIPEPARQYMAIHRL